MKTLDWIVWTSPFWCFALVIALDLLWWRLGRPTITRKYRGLPKWPAVFIAAVAMAVLGFFAGHLFFRI